jgi:hypothetical protein
VKTDVDRRTTIEAIATTANALAGVTDLVLADIHAARGEPEQAHHERPKLLEDLRDAPPDGDDEQRGQEPPSTAYADPTGERAIKADPATRDLAELDRRLLRIRTDLDTVSTIFQRHQAARTPAQIKDARTIAEGELDEAGDEWCRSHLRCGVLEPVTLRKSGSGAGKPYYAGMCKWCGELLATLKREHPKRFRTYKVPPMELVIISTYRKLRQSDVDALVGPQHKDRRRTKSRPGEDRKRRSA